MDGIDKQASQIICENVQIPERVGTNPAFVKCTLLVLRGMATPGERISFDREELRMRTQLKKRAQELALKALIELKYLEQVEKPAHGRTAAYRINHDAMIPNVPEAALDRAEKRLSSIRQRRTGAPDAHVQDQSGGGTGAPAAHVKPETGAPDASEQAHQLHTSKGTGAPGAQTGAPGALTGAPGAPDIKEETAIPAIPAAAAQRPRDLSAEQLLANAAAAAAVMDLDGWVELARQAGIERDLRRPLAGVLVDRGVQLAEHGLSSLERLSELIAGGNVKNPNGMLIKLLEGDPELIESPKTEARHRRRAHKLERFAGWLTSLTPFEQNSIMAKTHSILQGELGIDTVKQLMPGGRYKRRLRDWPGMLDFMHARSEELGITMPDGRAGAA